jgi:hypothetical protein
MIPPSLSALDAVAGPKRRFSTARLADIFIGRVRSTNRGTATTGLPRAIFYAAFRLSAIPATDNALAQRIAYAYAIGAHSR